jgi:hypothetical protein
MKPKAKTSGEYEAFSRLLGQVVRVPHFEIKARLEAEKKARKRKPRRASASRASSDKG